MGNEVWNMCTSTQRYHFLRVVNVRVNFIIQAVVIAFIEIMCWLTLNEKCILYSPIFYVSLFSYKQIICLPETTIKHFCSKLMFLPSENSTKGVYVTFLVQFWQTNFSTMHNNLWLCTHLYCITYGWCVPSYKEEENEQWQQMHLLCKSNANIHKIRPSCWHCNAYLSYWFSSLLTIYLTYVKRLNFCSILHCAIILCAYASVFRVLTDVLMLY